LNAFKEEIRCFPSNLILTHCYNNFITKLITCVRWFVLDCPWML